MISIAGRYKVPYPEEYLRENCSEEFYQGYEDLYNVNNTIINEDILAANRLHACIGTTVIRRLMGTYKLEVALSNVPNDSLEEITPEEWINTSSHLHLLIQEACRIPGVGLTTATKILHIKRPKLIPILDSFVIHILLQCDLKRTSKAELPSMFLKAAGVIKNDIEQQVEEFDKLKKQLKDLSIPLETVRIYDILVRSTERKGMFSKDSVPHGINKARFQRLNTLDAFEEVLCKKGYILVTDKANPNRIHRTDCIRLKRKWFETKVVFNGCRNGSYYYIDDNKVAQQEFKAVLCPKCLPESTQ